MQQRLDRFRGSPEGQEWMRHRRNLPVWAIKDALLAAVATADVVVVGGDTGCGKTTQVQPPDSNRRGGAISIGDHLSYSYSLSCRSLSGLLRLHGLPSVQPCTIACHTPAALCAMCDIEGFHLFFRAQARGGFYSAEASYWILFCPSLRTKPAAVYRQL